MDNFVAIDVETANYQPSSICAIGAVKVIDRCISERFYRLVKPEPNWYVRHFSDNVHGIRRCDTDNEPCFCDIWSELAQFIGNLPLVAHNKAFDERCIKATFKTYGMDYPDYRFFCTLAKARTTIPKQLVGSYSLPNLCEFMGIPFCNHHNALADAEACAKIAIAIL